MGDFGKLCVGMFLFISGLGLYNGFARNAQTATLKNSILRIKKLYSNYWTVFLLFVPIGFLYFSEDPRYAWNTKIFIKNLVLVPLLGQETLPVGGKGLVHRITRD